MAPMASAVRGSCALVTGGTGSFGQNMVEWLLSAGCAEVRVLSRDELKQELMRKRLDDGRLRFHIGDIRDYDSVLGASRGTDLILHAAALKQVPSCEFFPLEAVRTNVLGSANVIRAAESNAVPSLVCLSTDKAVYPINAMGMTKALLEKTAQSHPRNNPLARTTVSCVRYGNVMGSRGSVIPLFLEQLVSGVPVTLTAAGMTRFMMTMRDSVDLVEHALGHARPGDLFIRKLPACTMEDLVTGLVRLFGRDAEIKVIGHRHGEKTHECLATGQELARAEDLGDYYRIPLDSRDLNYSAYLDEGDVSAACPADYDSRTARRMTVPEIERTLAGLPEVRRALRAARGHVTM
ncbi:polysaccharide biosynthesis protein [Streptomyces sp. NPDC050617]|uniref:polysaccharide biosynthesis protein n=1 Tax=Streptomyces sp. NPDC050617 TaxID=3154628 RepID=UPI00342C89DA